MEHGYHDIGGETAGPVEQAEPAWPFWAKQSEAIRTILGDGTRRLVSLDELRRGVENVGPAEYERLSFYERRLVSMIGILEEKGVVTRAEVEARAAEIRRARAAS